MSLRIDRLNTTCHVPPQRRGDANLVDRLARGRFARDLGDHLGPSLARQPAIVRIRRLALRVVVPASELNEDALSLKWRQAFGKALFTALAYPAGAGPFEIYRAESVAGFVASAVRDLLDGTAPTKWQYAEFEAFFQRGATQAALALLCEWPRQTMAVLLELATRNVLDRVLARFDDLAMERLFAVLARPPDTETEALSVADLVTVARLALARLPEQTAAFRSRQYALSLFVEAHRSRQPVQSPRTVFHALLAIALLLNEDVFWPGLPHDETWAKRLPAGVTAVLESLARELREQIRESWPIASDTMPGGPQGRGEVPPFRFGDLQRILSGLQTRGGIQAARLAELHRLLNSLRVDLKVPPPSARSADVRWISSEWCGLFFLTSTLARLGWIPAWRQLGELQRGGVACLAAGLALAIAEKFDPAAPPLDPGIALFAGYLEDPDLAHLRRVCQEYPREVRLTVLRAALPHDSVEEMAESWRSTFDGLAGILLRDFAARIRGFRQATRQGIVRSFIARAGRIRIEAERIVVCPAPSPFSVALHISGMDAPVDPSMWLGGRRIEFELGEL